MKGAGGSKALTVLAAAIACHPNPIETVELVPSTLSQGLIAHWSFDEGTGSVVEDLSGNGRHGLLNGSRWVADGRFGGAMRFGENEFVSVDAFPDATPSFSVSAWVRLETFVQNTSTHWATIVSTEISSGGWELNIDEATASPGINAGFWKGPDQGDFDGVTCYCVEVGTWTHVAAVLDGASSMLLLYVGGALRETIVTSNRILPGSPTLFLGQVSYGGRFLPGDEDELAIWSRALSASEIASLVEHPVPPVM
jgi:hypothetical protein